MASPDTATGASALRPLSAFNLALRALTELGVVAGFAYWGVHVGSTTASEVLLGVLVPAVAFGIWGSFDFRGARHAEALRLLQELLISGLAAAALIAAGQPLLGGLLAAVTILHHGLVYALGERLLKDAPAGARPATPTSTGRSR